VNWTSQLETTQEQGEGLLNVCRHAAKRCEALRSRKHLAGYLTQAKGKAWRDGRNTEIIDTEIIDRKVSTMSGRPVTSLQP